MWPCLLKVSKSRLWSIWIRSGANLSLDRRLRWWRLQDDAIAEAVAEAIRNCVDGRMDDYEHDQLYMERVVLEAE